VYEAVNEIDNSGKSYL